MEVWATAERGKSEADAVARENVSSATGTSNGAEGIVREVDTRVMAVLPT